MSKRHMRYWPFSLAIVATIVSVLAAAGLDRMEELQRPDHPDVTSIETGTGSSDLPPGGEGADILMSQGGGGVVHNADDGGIGITAPPPLLPNQLHDQFDYHVKSTWFAFVSGIASVLGVVLALYQLRVRHYPHSRLRILEWQKIAMIAGGTGLLIFAGMSFYSQSQPPAIVLFRYAYDAIHGFCGSQWGNGPHYFTGGFQTPDYAVSVTAVEFLDEETRVKFYARCNGKNPCIPFPNPGLAIGTSQMFAPVNRDIQSSSTRLDGYLDFPNLSGKCGTLSLWDDRDAVRDNEGHLARASLRFTADIRENGTSVWGLLSILVHSQVHFVAYNFCHKPPM